METGFTPLSGLLGGALIGVASAGLLLANGRIAGISGILGGTLSPASRADLASRIAFLVGLPVGASLTTHAGSNAAGYAITSNPALLFGAGLLVGLGTQIGGGCTSGHGVCGIARGSKRSIVATLIFMAAGFASVFVMRHVIGSA